MYYSIIIPYFNRKEFLYRSLGSVLNQKIFQSKESETGEIILVDDGSIEEERVSLSQIQDFFRDTPGIRSKRLSLRTHREEENRGVSAARNQGVNLAVGEWLFFLDSDDAWKPDKLGRQLEYSLRNPQYRIHQTQEKWIRNGRFVNSMNKHKKTEGNLFPKSLEMCMITPSSVCIRKDLWEEIGGMDENLPACEDYDLWLAISSQYPIGLLDEELLTRYSGHPNQLSFAYPVMDRFRIYSLLKRGKTFTGSNLDMARRILLQKLKILIQGKMKRKKDSKVLQEILNWAEASYGLKDERIKSNWKTYLLNQSQWVD